MKLGDYNGVAYRFGPFVLDHGTRQLLRDGAEIHVSPKAFELLAMLVEHRPRAVSKAELQDRLWPSTFVEETNLAGLVAEVRRALGDSASEPAFLRTMYGFGYRFVGEVNDLPAPTPPGLAGPRPCLVVDDRCLPLLEGPNVIGRAPESTIRCEASGVSRHHARIILTNGVATLEDLGSKNGTFVGDFRVTSVQLSDGDEIHLGNARLIFRVDPRLEPTETVMTHPRA
jgi:DNA-binding winged helix-turn-helix (wHTH) protein